MKFSIPSAAIAVLAAFALPATATAQTAKCITADQVSALATAIIPGAISKLSERCASVLPEGAALRVSGANAATQYRDAALAAQPKAYEAMQVIAGEELPDGLSAEVVFPFVEAMLFSEIDKAKPDETCPVANNLWSAMKALPFENWGLVLATIITADQADKAKDGEQKTGKRNSVRDDLAICPYVAMES